MSQETNIIKLCSSCIASLQTALNSNISRELSLQLNQKLFLLETALEEFKSQHIDFEEICNHLLDAIYVSDKNGKTIYVNQVYLAFSGLRKEDFVGKSVYEINKEKKLYTNGVIPTVIETRQKTDAVGTVISTNKKIYISGIPIFDEEGDLKYAVAHDKDIDQLEQLKTALEVLKAENASSAAELAYLRSQQLESSEELICRSPNLKEAVQTAKTVAATDVTVLITGESGSGKEVLADIIYNAGNRSSKPFIKINCSAIPGNLLESELFGYAGGAFTGALKNGKPGLFEIANGGVILLDEIGDMPMDLQTKILRTIQEREVCRIGSSKVIPLDVRILAATNRDLPEAIKHGTFREDLYYRLNVVPIHLLPLRERPEDITPLVTRFLNSYNKKYSKAVTLTSGAMSVLEDYNWPGNIRELKNIMERMVVINTSGEIDAATVKQVLGILPVAAFRATEPAKTDALQTLSPQGSTQSSQLSGTASAGSNQTDALDTAIASYLNRTENNLKKTVEAFETDIIRKAIAEKGSKRKAAAALGMDHSTLIKKCQRYGIPSDK